METTIASITFSVERPLMQRLLTCFIIVILLKTFFFYFTADMKKNIFIFL